MSGPSPELLAALIDKWNKREKLGVRELSIEERRMQCQCAEELSDIADEIDEAVHAREQEAREIIDRVTALWDELAKGGDSPVVGMTLKLVSVQITRALKGDK